MIDRNSIRIQSSTDLHNYHSVTNSMNKEEHERLFLHVAVKEPGKPLELISVERAKIEIWLNEKFPKGRTNSRANFEHDVACLFSEGVDPTQPSDPTVERFMKEFMDWDKDIPGPRGTVVFDSSWGNSISDKAYDWLCDKLK